MSQMSELPDFVEIFEKSLGFVGETDDINRYLQAGWVIFATYTSGDYQFGQRQVYCMGWRRDLGPVVHPEKPELTEEDYLGSYEKWKSHKQERSNESRVGKTEP